jgi:uncharacterized protein
MNEKELIASTVAFVQETLTEAEGGHDWFHIERVWLNAQLLLQAESEVDNLVVELGALLHDIADPKFHDGDESVGPEMARTFLLSQGVDTSVIGHVVKIIEHVSFKNSIYGQKWSSPELEVVQDADRLDALGAIGIARTFNYGGHAGRALYDPAIEPNLNMTKEEYKNSTAPTLNHFYEKVFLLKDRINTEAGKKLAKERHQYMVQFVDRFKAEWRGEM